MNNEERDTFLKLKAHDENQFPRKCSCCGKVFNSISDFLKATDFVNKNNGLQSVKLDKDVIVELYRNCTCGSTLMAECSDRRDRSKKGVEYRKNFKDESR